MSLEYLRHIAATIGQRRGWNFSQVRMDRDPVPWDYADVVRRFLKPSSRVLDVGTGGGEQFIDLAPHLGVGVGVDIDPGMIKVARENRSLLLADEISFEVMRAEALQFSDATFDIVLNRHTPVHVGEVLRVLRSGGYFITQQVGARNAQNICDGFGCGPGGEYEPNPSQNVALLVDALRQHGFPVICTAAYNVRSFFLDVESLIFWLKAIPIPEDFDIERHGQQVQRIITKYRTSRGIETNEHRELIIAHKS